MPLPFGNWARASEPIRRLRRQVRPGRAGGLGGHACLCSGGSERVHGVPVDHLAAPNCEVTRTREGPGAVGRPRPSRSGGATGAPESGGTHQKPIRQRAYAALSVTQRSSLGMVSPPTHWKSLFDRDSPHSNNASDWAGQSSAPSSHSPRQSARVPAQTSGRAHKPAQPVAPLALLPPAPAAPLLPAEPPVPLPAEPAAPLLPAEPPPPPLPPAPAAPLLPAEPPAPPLPAAPVALLPALPAALPSPPSSSEQAGGKLMRSNGTSQAVRIQLT